MTKKEFDLKLENAMFYMDVPTPDYYEEKIHKVQMDLIDLRKEDDRSNAAIIDNLEEDLFKLFALQEDNRQEIENLKERVLNGEEFC